MKNIKQSDWAGLVVALLVATHAAVMWPHLRQFSKLSQWVETVYAEQVPTPEFVPIVTQVPEVESEPVQEVAEKPVVAPVAVSEPEVPPTPVVEPEPVVEAPALDPNYKVNPTAIMDAAGISAVDRVAVNFIIANESGWRPFAWNEGGSGAYGLCQALPGNKMASAGADWETNPVTQLRWCSQYAAGKGGWIAAANLWRSQYWW